MPLGELKDLLTERTDNSRPRDLKINSDRVSQVCCLDLGMITPEVAKQALQVAQNQGFIANFAIVYKGDQTGTYATIVASSKQLKAFNRSFRLGEATRWKGSQVSNWPAWAKRADGSALHSWLGVE